MFTGLDPPRHGVRQNGEFRLARSVTTLAELLQAKDYDTAAFVSAFDLDARFGLDQGFDHYDATTAPVRSMPMGHPGERSAEAVTDAALSWLRARGSSARPSFIWVHYRDPHLPYHATGELQAVGPADPYDAELAYVDSQIGRLLDGVRGAGAWDNTLIIVAGDHGESLGEHGESDHSLLIYGSTQRVPLLLACPGLFAGPYVVDDVVVGAVDIYPTVLDLLGIESPRSCNGMSLVRAARCKDRVIYMETLAPYLEKGWSPLYALRRHKDKFIFAPEREYYTLDLDPGERMNLYRDMSPRTRTARTELEKAMVSYFEDAAPLNDLVMPCDDLDDAARARLELLDYVTGTVVESYVDALDPKYLIYTWEDARKAEALTESGNLEVALAKLHLGLAVSPNDRQCLERIGTMYAMQNRPSEAEEAFRRAIEIRPGADLYVALAQTLMVQNKLDDASELLDRAEVLEPANGGIFIARGDIACMRGKIDVGLAAYRKAKRVDPYRFSDIAEMKLQTFRTADGGRGSCDSDGP